jgi:hypothetical protein
MPTTPPRTGSSLAGGRKTFQAGNLDKLWHPHKVKKSENFIFVVPSLLFNQLSAHHAKTVV